MDVLSFCLRCHKVQSSVNNIKVPTHGVSTPLPPVLLCESFYYLKQIHLLLLFLQFTSSRLLNAELEAKTASLVRQAEQLMVSYPHIPVINSNMFYCLWWMETCLVDSVFLDFRGNMMKLCLDPYPLFSWQTSKMKESWSKNFMLRKWLHPHRPIRY